jgi:hypothetical protein
MTRPRSPGPVSLLAALSCVLAASAAAAEPAQAPAQPTAAAQAQAQARYVVRDAQTGLLRAPTEEELSAMLAREKPLARAAAPRATVVRKYPGGMRGAVLGAEHLVTLQAQRRADGTVDINHTDPAQAHPASGPQLPTE